MINQGLKVHKCRKSSSFPIFTQAGIKSTHKKAKIVFWYKIYLNALIHLQNKNHYNPQRIGEPIYPFNSNTVPWHTDVLSYIWKDWVMENLQSYVYLFDSQVLNHPHIGYDPIFVQDLKEKFSFIKVSKNVYMHKTNCFDLN